MKRFITLGLFILAGFFLTSSAFAQTTMQNFFYTKGVQDLCKAAHVTNDYESGTYDVKDDYVDITFISKESVFGGDVSTKLRLIRGLGGLTFTDIIVVSDGDMVAPFKAFGLQTSLLITLVKSADQESFQKLKQAIIDKFQTDPEQWDGKTWALLGLNLNYMEYAMKN